MSGYHYSKNTQIVKTRVFLHDNNLNEPIGSMGENQESPEVQKKPEAGALDRLTYMIAKTPSKTKPLIIPNGHF